MTMKVNGKQHGADGEGTLRTADGTKYKGHFVKGKEDGKGVLEDKNGVRYDGFSNKGRNTALLWRLTRMEM